MTTLEIPRNETLRGQARLLRRLRRDGISVCARQRLVSPEPAEVVEFAYLGERRWLAAIVDAKSRGTEGAAIVREVVRHVVARAGAARHLGDVLASANDIVFDSAAGDELVSAFLFVLDGARRTFRLANAGQSEPLAAGRAGGVVAIETKGPALGLLREQGYRAAGPLRLPPGMVVLAVTDGVRDAVDREGHAFGREGSSRALAAVRSRGPRAVVRRVLEDVAAHGAADEADDRTALAFAFRR